MRCLAFHTPVMSLHVHIATAHVSKPCGSLVFNSGPLRRDVSDLQFPLAKDGGTKVQQ